MNGLDVEVDGEYVKLQNEWTFHLFTESEIIEFMIEIMRAQNEILINKIKKPERQKMNEEEMTAWWKNEAKKHADYMDALVKKANPSGIYSLDFVRFQYETALIHGFKHGIEKAKELKSELS